jgi:signal transduction histidine kinase
MALAMTLALSLYAVRSLSTASDLVEHTAMVKFAVAEVGNALIDAETGQRGYLLTDNEDYLQPYRDARSRLDAMIVRLRELVVDDRGQLATLGNVDRDARSKLNELEEALEARTTRGMPAALAVIDTNRGKRLMDALRSGLAAMNADEDRLLATREDAQARDATLAIAALVVTSVLFGLLAAVARSLRRSARAQQKLRDAEAARLLADNERLAEKARTTQFQEQFVAILGHDLRSPLQALQLGLSVLETTPPSSRSTAIARMAASTRRIERMVTQLLDLARSRLAGGIAITPVAADLGRLVRGVADELRIARPNTALIVESDGDLTGEWDADRLEQVASNLIGNAIDHGGTSAPVRVTLHGEPDRVTLEVHNDGPAIPEPARGTLFEPYQDSRERRRKAGLGLGLYITKEIVAAHAGTIAVASVGDAGTTFTVTLPRHAEA